MKIQNNINKIIFTTFAISLLLLAITVYIFSKVAGNTDQLLDDYRSKIGKSVIINQDTIMIIDYSVIRQNYILEDNREISIHLIDKVKVLDRK